MKTFAKHTACFIVLTVLLSLLSPAASAQNVSLQNNEEIEFKDKCTLKQKLHLFIEEEIS